MKFIYRFVITSSLIGIIIWKMGGIRKVGELLAGMNLAYLLVITPMTKKFSPSHRINSCGTRSPFRCRDKISCDLVIAGRRVKEYLLHRGFSGPDLEGIHSYSSFLFIKVTAKAI
jgi:hypothetical protein